MFIQLMPSNCPHYSTSQSELKGLEAEAALPLIPSLASALRILLDFKRRFLNSSPEVFSVIAAPTRKRSSQLPWRSQ